MTKIEFTNIPNGTVVKSKENHVQYTVRERMCRKLILQRINPIASMSLIEIVNEARARKEYEVVR